MHVDASEQFLGRLAGVTDPEAKRKIIGREFVEVFQAEAQKLSKAKWLAQGTIYPDVVESGGTKTKSDDDQEPPQRRRPAGNARSRCSSRCAICSGRSARAGRRARPAAGDGVPPSVPGSGLGVRILGEVKREFADLLRRADAIFIEELRNTTATAQDAAAGLCAKPMSARAGTT